MTPTNLHDSTPPPMPRAIDAWPDGPLLAYCGDDFTGSTDVMEAFTAAGVSTVLFLRPPEPHWVERLADVRCIGLATTARGQSPAWMDAHLPEAFAALRRFGAPLLQYKVCSTFDSSPELGSIGRAIDLGVAAMGGAWSPMVVGAPRLRRWLAFGQLFAGAADGQVHRLDRHPTMSRHPVTPMREADLRLHLAEQTSRPTALIDLAHMKSGQGDARRAALTAGTAGAGDGAAVATAADQAAPIVLLDVVDEQTLAEAGRLIWQGRGAGLFSASSSGLQDALAAQWRAAGCLGPAPGLPEAEAVDRIAVVSGSCSPATAAQIAWAGDHGFALHRLAIPRLLDPSTRAGEIDAAVAAAAAALARGASPLVYSAQGPDDPAVSGFGAGAAAVGLSREAGATVVGAALAGVMRQLLDQVPALRRVVVAGGDSSGAVASELDIAALSAVAALAPGAPLCRAWSDLARRDGLQIVLKGGQMGAADFFGLARSGISAGR